MKILGLENKDGQWSDQSYSPFKIQVYHTNRNNCEVKRPWCRTIFCDSNYNDNDIHVVLN